MTMEVATCVSFGAVSALTQYSHLKTALKLWRPGHHSQHGVCRHIRCRHLLPHQNDVASVPLTGTAAVSVPVFAIDDTLTGGQTSRSSPVGQDAASFRASPPVTAGSSRPRLSVLLLEQNTIGRPGVRRGRADGRRSPGSVFQRGSARSKPPVRPDQRRRDQQLPNSPGHVSSASPDPLLCLLVQEGQPRE